MTSDLNQQVSIAKTGRDCGYAAEAAGPGLPSVLSLFCGAGGLDWGFQRESFQIALAIDKSSAAVKTHERNFRSSAAICADLEDLKPAGVVSALLERVQAGSRIGVIGGPPCQGFSRANTGRTGDDPRNRLPELYLSIVRHLQECFAVEFMVFENVLGMRDRKHAQVYSTLVEGISSRGFAIDEHTLCAIDFGVPQTRKRIILTAIRCGRGYSSLRAIMHRSGPATVAEAIGGLEQPAFFERNLNPANIPVHPNHWTMQPKSARFSAPAELRPDTRSFKCLRWDRPSPTIAFGHREIHVHPDGTRRLSIFEAMLLQGFPDSFVLEGNLSEQVEQISNAVPPPMARSIAAAVSQSLLGE